MTEGRKNTPPSIYAIWAERQPDGPSRYEVRQKTYGNTGGGCMVGTLEAYLPELDKTVWVNCNDEGVAVTSADCIWNEDGSGSWERYEDVLLFQVDLRTDAPEDAGPLLPLIREALAYTIDQETARMGRDFQLPPSGCRMSTEERCR